MVTMVAHLDVCIVVCMVVYMYIYMCMVLRKFSAVHAVRKAPRENQATQLYTEQSKAQKPAFTGLNHVYMYKYLYMYTCFEFDVLARYT